MTTIFSNASSGLSAGSGDKGVSIRDFFPITGASLGQVRVTLGPIPSGSYDFDHIAIAVLGTATEPNTQATPTELKWSGASGYHGTGGVASDWVTFSCLSTDTLCLIQDFTSAGGGGSGQSGYEYMGAGYVEYAYLASSTYNQATPGGSPTNSAGYLNNLTLIETQSGGGGTTVALTGVSDTGSVGAFTPSNTTPLTGVQDTGSVGSFTPGNSTALGGVQDTGSVGTFALSVALGLSGVQDVGSVQPFSGFPTTVSLQGLLSTTALGSFGIINTTVSTTIPPGPTAYQTDYMLVAPTLGLLQSAAQGLGLWNNVSNDFLYVGRAPDGGWYKLVLQGSVIPPSGQFTYNRKIGAQSPIPYVPQIWARLYWFSNSPLPNYPYFGVALTPYTPQ